MVLHAGGAVEFSQRHADDPFDACGRRCAIDERSLNGELKLEPVVIEAPKKTKADKKAAEKKPAKKKEVSEKQDKAQPAKPKKKEGADKAKSKSGK